MKINKKLKYSYHVHSLFSDGKNSIEELIAGAKELGLDEIGISDHFNLSKADNLSSWDMSLNKLKDYVLRISAFSNMTKPIVKLGLEVEFISETVEEFREIAKMMPFDYLIGSVHLVDRFLIDSPWEFFLRENKLDELPKDFCNEIARDYWILIREMAQSRVFDIVGHLELYKKFNIQPQTDLTEEIKSALEAIKDADMTVELNTSGLYYPCKEQYPSFDLLKKCKKLDIPVIITADAHQKEHLTRGFDIAYKLLKEAGYTRQAYFTKKKRFFTDL
ncbi:MAG: histidinol-phosphatase [Parachlamydiales bacterium]